MRLRLFLTLPFLFHSAFSQGLSIRGTVVDTNGAPVQNAAVSLSCTEEQVVTDDAGEFSFGETPVIQKKRVNAPNPGVSSTSQDFFSLNGQRHTLSLSVFTVKIFRGKQGEAFYKPQTNGAAHTTQLSKRAALPCRLKITSPGLLPKHIILEDTDTLLGNIVMEKRHISDIGLAWARNTVNTAIFRWNSTVSFGNTQYVSYYNADGYMVLAKRTLGTDDWTVKQTQYKGNINDAHNVICLGIDGSGILHVAWDHHGHPLRYAQSVSPGSLELTDKMSMTGRAEGNVTYPEFYQIPNGDLLFLYRDGASGDGNVLMNRFDNDTRKWSVVTHNFISGQGQRNGYWMFTVGHDGSYHIAWNWRETSGVESNHDLCYAKSDDGGKTWKKTTGETYQLPITAGTAEYAWKIPQNSEMINTTSIQVDSNGHPAICTYWRESNSNIPQYHVVYYNGETWQHTQVTQRTTPFSLSGGGTKKIPISRPKLLIGPDNRMHMIYRDVERKSFITVASSTNRKDWTYEDISPYTVSDWEPSYDPAYWAEAGVMHIYMQNAGQGDGETTTDLPPQMVSILEWAP